LKKKVNNERSDSSNGELGDYSDGSPKFKSSLVKKRQIAKDKVKSQSLFGRPTYTKN